LLSQHYNGAITLKLETKMMDDKTKEIVRILNQPHRCTNMMALFRSCETAATLIQDQAAELAALKAKPTPKSKKH
jgi:hypothetical protein|tara:strand:- start:215 stop:439 length:225 start_codon:yes stop_codon:yes gene_type:complete